MNAAILTGGPALAKARTEALPFLSTHREVALLSAKISMLVGRPADALAALQLAPASRSQSIEALEADEAFEPLHGEPAFRAAFGWLPSQPTNAPPDLTAFKRFRKVVEKSPARFNRGASAAELKKLENTLEVPKAWRALLASLNGAAFRDGRDHLYSTTELIAANANNAEWQPIFVGRRLELVVGKSTVGLFRKTATSEHTSKTIDEGLAALATGRWDR